MKTLYSKLASFVTNAAESFFPIHNLPYGVFKRKNDSHARVGTAIGDYVLDLAFLEKIGLIHANLQFSLFDHDCLNVFASQSQEIVSFVRKRIQSLLSIENKELQDNSELLTKALIPQNEIEMLLPFKIGGFSDFYAAEHHATNVGKLFRGNENALLPNWKCLPVAYNGRASTVFISGKEIHRPKGQVKLPNQENPIYTPTKKLDFELEMGIFVGMGNVDGKRISVNDATAHVFGLVLLNDWSARDIQAFEYQPLGPFLSKSFATSISPWVVPLEALQAFMQPLPEQVPEPVAYLKQSSRQLPDIKLKVEIQPKNSYTRTLICETTPTELYWTMEQMLAHHTVNHCIMKPGDLLGTGTISGANRESWGSLLEITFNGKNPIALQDGQTRTFLEDGDTVIITGYCQAEHYKIGFGSLEGTILPAVQD